jgi:hypothetical protein
MPDDKPMKTEGGAKYPAADYAFVPDPAKPTTWKLRMTLTPGKLDMRILGDACAALGKGFRGNKVDLPPDSVAGVKAKLRGAYAKLGVKGAKLPAALQEAATQRATAFPILCLSESTDTLSEAADTGWLADGAVEEGDDRHRPLIATIIHAGDNKSGTRRYTPEFLQKCIGEGRFSGSYGYMNHPTVTESRDRPERDLRFLAVRTGEAFWDPSEGPQGAVKAPLVWLAEGHPSSMGALGAALFSDPVVRQRSGLSIHYQGPVQVDEVDVPGGRRKLQVPKALGDDRKFDIDVVTHPGAGGGLPLLESERRNEQEATQMAEELTYEEWKEHADYTARLLAENVPAPVEKPAVPVAEVAVVAPTADPAVAELREEVTRMKAERASEKMLEEFLRVEPVDETIREAARKALIGEVFTTNEAFTAKARAVVDGMKEVASQASGPRVAGLGGAPSAPEQKPLTWGDVLKPKEKEG